MRRAAKVDLNHAEVKAALSKAGWRCIDLSRAGCGVPDLLIAKAGRLALVEVKGEKGKLNPEQRRFHVELANYGVTIQVIRTADEAARL